jgi:hypothetical protein
MPRRTARLILLVASVTLAVGVCEAWLRNIGGVFHDRFTQPDFERGWSLRPGFAGWMKGERVMWMSINRAGMRDREHAVEAPPRTLRVAVLGDSYMQGLNVPPDKMFTTFLESRLREQCVLPGGWNVEVLNFGVTGYGTAQEWLTYRHHAARYKPDLVVLAVYTNNDIFNNHRQLNPTAYPEQSPYFTLDGDRLVLDASFRQVLADGAIQPWWRRGRMFLTERLRAAQLLYESWGAIRPYVIAPQPESEDAGNAATEEIDLEGAIYSPPAIPEVADAWQVTEAIMLQLARDVRADGGEPWIVTLANGPQIDSDPEERRHFIDAFGIGAMFYPDRRIRDFAAHQGIHAVALAEPLAEYVAASGASLRGGYSAEVPLGSGHWNEHGNLVAANLLADRLCKDSPTLTGHRPGGLRGQHVGYDQLIDGAATIGAGVDGAARRMP